MQRRSPPTCSAGSPNYRSITSEVSRLRLGFRYARSPLTGPEKLRKAKCRMGCVNASTSIHSFNSFFTAQPNPRTGSTLWTRSREPVKTGFPTCSSHKFRRSNSQPILPKSCGNKAAFVAGPHARSQAPRSPQYHLFPTHGHPSVNPRERDSS